MHMCMCLYVYIDVCVSLYIYIYTHIYIYIEREREVMYYTMYLYNVRVCSIPNYAKRCYTTVCRHIASLGTEEVKTPDPGGVGSGA